jgi:hypothetical protein
MTPTNPPPPDPPVTRAEVDHVLSEIDEAIAVYKTAGWAVGRLLVARATVERLAKGGGVGA